MEQRGLALENLQGQDEVVEAVQVQRGVQRHPLCERLFVHAIYDVRHSKHLSIRGFGIPSLDPGVHYAEHKRVQRYDKPDALSHLMQTRPQPNRHCQTKRSALRTTVSIVDEFDLASVED